MSGDSSRDAEPSNATPYQPGPRNMIFSINYDMHDIRFSARGVKGQEWTEEDRRTRRLLEEFMRWYAPLMMEDRDKARAELARYKYMDN